VDGHNKKGNKRFQILESTSRGVPEKATLGEVGLGSWGNCGGGLNASMKKRVIGKWKSNLICNWPSAVGGGVPQRCRERGFPDGGWHDWGILFGQRVMMKPWVGEITSPPYWTSQTTGILWDKGGASELLKKLAQTGLREEETNLTYRFGGGGGGVGWGIEGYGVGGCHTTSHYIKGRNKAKEEGNMKPIPALFCEEVRSYNYKKGWRKTPRMCKEKPSRAESKVCGGGWEGG